MPRAPTRRRGGWPGGDRHPHVCGRHRLQRQFSSSGVDNFRCPKPEATARPPHHLRRPLVRPAHPCGAFGGVRERLAANCAYRHGATANRTKFGQPRAARRPISGRVACTPAFCSFALSYPRTTPATERIGRVKDEPNGAPAARFGGCTGLIHATASNIRDRILYISPYSTRIVRAINGLARRTRCAKVPAPISHISRFAAYAAPGDGGSGEGCFMAEQANWSLPEQGSREDRALQWLALVEPPRGIVLPASLWLPAARASGLSVHRIKRLARRAAAAGDPHVAWYAEHLARLGRRTPRGPTDLARARLANWLRKRGLSWKRIARVLGYSEKGSGAEARKAAALYRVRLANGGTLPRARLAYKRRERGEPWAHIARKVGYVGARSARVMARRYAERAGLPWPVPVRVSPSAS